MQILLNENEQRTREKKIEKQVGAELCQAQISLSLV